MLGNLKLKKNPHMQVKKKRNHDGKQKVVRI